MKRIVTVLAVVLVCARALVAGSGLEEGAVSAVGEKGPRIDPEAREVLRDAARFFEELKSLSFTETTTYEWQYGDKSGRSTKKLTVWARKPNRIKWRRTQDKRGPTEYYYNGDSAVNCWPRRNQRVFHVQDGPSSLHKFYEKVARGTGLYPLKFAMLADNPYEAWLSLVKRVAYEGRVVKNGTPCHHLKATVRDAEDKQFVANVWLVAEGKPVIGQISADLPKSEGGTETTVTLRYGEWEFDPELVDGAFKFIPGPNTIPLWETPRNAMLGTQAPELDLELLDGDRLKLSEHRGSDVVILDFWATWCGPCVRSLPDVVEVADAVEGVHLYAVNMQEKPEKIRRFLKKEELEVQVALDRDGSAAEKYDIWGIPAVFVIGKDGSVQALGLGLRGPDADKEKAIDGLGKLLKGGDLDSVKKARLHRNMSQMVDQTRWVWGRETRIERSFANPFDRDLTLRVWMEIPGGKTFDPTELRIPAGKERTFSAVFSVPPADTEVLPVIKYVLECSDWTGRSIRRIRPRATGHYVENEGKLPEDVRMRLQYGRQVVSREEDGLRFHVDVVDDTLKAPSRKPWLNDAVEIFLDIRPPGSRGENKQESGWFQVIAVPEIGQTMPNSLHYYAAGEERKTPQWMTMESGVIAEGYWLEIYMPYDGLEAAHGRVPEEFRFEYAVDDADGQEAPTTQMAWSGGLNTNAKPHLWGILSICGTDSEQEE